METHLEVHISLQTLSKRDRPDILQVPTESEIVQHHIPKLDNHPHVLVYWFTWKAAQLESPFLHFTDVPALKKTDQGYSPITL